MGIFRPQTNKRLKMKAEAVASTVEHPKGSIPRLSTQNQKRD